MARSHHGRSLLSGHVPAFVLVSGLCLLAAMLSKSCRTVEEPAGAPQGLDRAAFLRADIDGDGGLSPEELARHLHHEALAEFDLDGDGSISVREWGLAKPSAGESDPLFREIDADGDGLVAEDEAVAYLLRLEGFHEAFAELDRGGDGSLEWKELRSAEAGLWRVGLFAPATRDP